MGKKKTSLEQQLERSLKLLAQAKETNDDVHYNSLGERLRALDEADKPDALAGDEAFEEHDDDPLSDWWD